MRKDYRPYAAKKGWLKFQKLYTRHFIAPQLQSLGKGYVFMNPWHVRLFGGPIEIGDYSHFIAASDGKIRISVWPASGETQGRIRIGSYTLVCPGVRISAARQIVIEDNCMLAYGVYITDNDWHGLYNRLAMGRPAPVHLGNNVWVGDSAIICKGVTIGENSIIGAGAVVVTDIAANTVAAGNPARVVKALDPDEPLTTRERWFADPARLSREFMAWEKAVLKGNTFLGWLRHVLFPAKGD
ncbi:MAG: acyltransferase [Desulfatitalea sp.]|nr:acyltransferase [Desulfatitalea sp.]NNK02670.1 acyltransferase [Desulfatitalea sp.]